MKATDNRLRKLERTMLPDGLDDGLPPEVRLWIRTSSDDELKAVLAQARELLRKLEHAEHGNTVAPA